MRPRPSRIGPNGWTIGGWVFLVAITPFACLPMLAMLVTSLETRFAALRYPPKWSPSTSTLEG